MDGMTSLEREIAKLKKEVEQSPQNIKLKLKYGHACLIRDKRLEALSVYQDILKDVDQADAHLALAKIYMLQGYYAEAYEELRRLFALDPISVQGHIVLHMLTAYEALPEDLVQHRDFIPSKGYLKAQRTILERDRTLLESQIAEYSALVFGVSEPEAILQYCVLETRKSLERVNSFIAKCDEWAKNAIDTGDIIENVEVEDDLLASIESGTMTLKDIPSSEKESETAEGVADSKSEITDDSVISGSEDNTADKEQKNSEENSIVAGDVEDISKSEDSATDVEQATTSEDIVENTSNSAEAESNVDGSVSASTESAVSTGEGSVVEVISDSDVKADEEVKAEDNTDFSQDKKETVEEQEIKDLAQSEEVGIISENNENEATEVVAQIESRDDANATVEIVSETEGNGSTGSADSCGENGIEEDEVPKVELNIDVDKVSKIISDLFNTRGFTGAVLYNQLAGVVVKVGEISIDKEARKHLTDGLNNWRELNEGFSCWILEGKIPGSKNNGMVYIQNIKDNNALVICSSSNNLGALRLGVDKIVPRIESSL